MRRASKILTLILVVVFLFGIFAGCDLVGKDVKKYRQTQVLNVGNESVTVGKLLDTFNTYYNNYYYYISYGYFTIDDVLDLAVQALINQYVKVDAYVKDATPQNNNTTLHNAKYLTQEQLDYCISYVKYLVFSALDSSVMEKVEAKHELNDAEADDTSRDFYEFDDLKGAATYAEYYLNQRFTNEDMDDYLNDYFDEESQAKFAVLDFSESALQELYVAGAEKKVAEINERIDDDADKLEKSEYVGYQQSVLKQYRNTIKSTYGLALDEFVVLQVEDLIASSITSLYDFTIYQKIEQEAGDMNEVLRKNYDTLKAAQQAEFAISKNFESFIESLSSSSLIYDVPEEYEESYVFVKNILIPFSSAQTAKLNSLKAELGTEDSELYVKYRNLLASQIVAEDFNSEKDEDGKHAKLENNPFIVDGNGNVVINPACTELSDYLHADGSVTAKPGMTNDEIIIELMKRFNTDTAQHSALYSYVVRVGDVPASYKHRWVDEFVEATNAAMALGGKGNYGIAVSNYGVHIVYVEGYVEEQRFDFTDNYLDTEKPLYRLFTTYFNTQSTKLLADALEDLRDEYIKAGSITETKVFQKFLKENGIDYDLAAKLSKED